MAEGSFLNMMSNYGGQEGQEQQQDPEKLHHQKVMLMMMQSSVPNSSEEGTKYSGNDESQSDDLMNYLKTYSNSGNTQQQNDGSIRGGDYSDEPNQSMGNFANIETDYGTPEEENQETNKREKLNVTNFTLEEFMSKDGSEMPKEIRKNILKLMPELQVLRDDIGKPVIINSGYRSPEHNKNIPNAAKDSQHTHGRGADIRVDGMSPKELYDRIEHLINTGQMEQGGLGLYKSHVHYDNRGTKARW